jgi:hypothetical protein
VCELFDGFIDMILGYPWYCFAPGGSTIIYVEETGRVDRAKNDRYQRSMESMILTRKSNREHAQHSPHMRLKNYSMGVWPLVPSEQSRHRAVLSATRCCGEEIV